MGIILLHLFGNKQIYCCCQEYLVLLNQIFIIYFMSCHFSCTTCSSSSFNACSVCPSGSTLYSSACFCDASWDSNCTLLSTFKPIFQSLDSFYLCLVALVMLLFCLKAKTPLSYRVIVNMQGLSMLILTNQYYLYYETFFGLKTLYKSNGFYPLGTNRLQNTSFYFALPAIVLFCSFLIGLLFMYYPIKTFVKQYQTYKEYLSDNWYHFYLCFYFFSVRSMVYFIGQWLNTFSTSIVDLAILSIFGFMVSVTVFKTIYDFHKNKLQNEIYDQQIYLYIVLSPLSIAGLPFAQSSITYMIVYLTPLGLLFLLILLNRSYEICTKQKVCLYLVELIVPLCAVMFIILSDAIKSVVVLIAVGLSTLIMIIELSVVYNSGVSLQRSGKVHPQQAVSNKSQEQQINKDKKVTKKTIRKASYF